MTRKVTLHIVQVEEEGIPDEPFVFDNIEEAGLKMQEIAVSAGRKPKPEGQSWQTYLIDTSYDLFDEGDGSYGARWWEVEAYMSDDKADPVEEGVEYIEFEGVKHKVKFNSGYRFAGNSLWNALIISDGEGMYKSEDAEYIADTVALFFDDEEFNRLSPAELYEIYDKHS